MSDIELVGPPNRLPELRAAKRTQEGGWTQQLTAAAAKISYNRYWRIENREADPTVEERARLAELFGVPERSIFPTQKRTKAA